MQSRNSRRSGLSLRARLGMEHLENRALMAVVAGPPDLLPESDSGISNRDNLTNVTTPTFQVRAAGAEGVTLFRVGDPEPLGRGVPGSRPGSWVVTSRELGDGVHSIQAQADGSTRLSRPLKIEIRTVASAATPSVSLCSCTDSGVKGDGVTNAVAPRLVGTAPSRAAVSLAIQGGAPLGTVKASPRGQWAFIARGNALPEGTHVIQATATDVFGNQTGVGTTTLTIDRQRPTAAIAVTGIDSFRVTFDRPVTGFDRTLRGMSFSGRPEGERAFNLPFTSPRLRNSVGPIVVTPSGDGRIYDVSFPEFGPSSGEYTLRLSARSSRIVDAVAGNSLASDASVTFPVA